MMAIKAGWRELDSPNLSHTPPPPPINLSKSNIYSKVEGSLAKQRQLPDPSLPTRRLSLSPASVKFGSSHRGVVNTDNIPSFTHSPHFLSTYCTLCKSQRG